MKNKQKILLITSLAFFLLLFGCNEQLSRSERNACFEMALKTYANVPECFDEKQCYYNVEKLFKTELDYSGETKLYEVKSQVARSWLQFNLARKEAKKLQEACLEGIAEKIPPLVNQTRFHLEASMREMDSAMKKSFEFISLEEKILSSEKIDLVKEEKIFENLIELRKILSELTTGATNSESYVSYYLKRAEAFNQAGQLRGFENIVEKESFVLAQYDYFEKIISQNEIAQKVGFPSISKTLRNAIKYIENEAYSYQSLSVLYRFPIGEFMQLYSSMGGQTDSALSRFSELANKLSENKKTLLKNNAEYWKNVEEEAKKSKILISDYEKFSKYSMLATKLIKRQSFGKETIIEKKNSVEKKLMELRIAKSEGIIPLGEEIEKIKEILNEYKALNLELIYQKTELLDVLEKACTEKCEEIKRTTRIENSALETLRQNSIYFANKSNNSTGEEKLEYCEKAIAFFEEFQEGLKDFEKLEAKKIDSTRECFDFLEKIFKQVELKELEKMFQNLKKQIVTKENIFYFQEECENIKKQVQKEIEHDETIKNIKKNLEELEKILEQLEKIGESNEIKKYLEKKKEIEELLKQKKYQEIYPIKKEINEKIINWKKEAEDYLKKKIEEYAKKYFEIIVLSQEVPETNKVYYSIKKLLIKNPFSEIESNFFIDINAKNYTRINSSKCVDKETIYFDNVRIYFNCLEEGINFVDYNSEGFASYKEEEKIIFSTNVETTIKKKINLEGNEKYPKLLFRIKNPKLNIQKILLLINGNEQIASSELETTFVAENVSKETEISIIYFVKDIILISKELENIQEKTNETILRYTIKAKNNYGKELDSTLIFPISAPEFFEKIILYDSSRNEIKTHIVEDKIVVKNQHFLEMEEKNYYLEIKVSNLEEYYKNILKKLLEELEKHQETEISTKIKALLEKPISKNAIKIVEEIIKEAQKKLEQIKKTEIEELEKKLIRENLEKKLKELEENLKKLIESGMEEEGLSLKEIIEKAKKLIESQNKGDLVKAEELISKKIFDISEAILEKIRKIKTEIIKKEDKTEKEKLLLEEIEEFEQKIIYEPWNATENYQKIIKLKKEIEDEYLKAVPPSKKIIELINECLKKVELLEKNLSVGEEELIKAKFIQPITSSRLKKIRITLMDYNYGVKNEKYALEDLEKIKKELNEAIDSIKIQAIRAYNNGIDLKLDEEILIKSKEAIDKNEYTKAIVLLKRTTTGMFSGGFITNQIIPIILIIVVAVVIKKAYNKKRLKEENQKEIILKEWK